VPTPTQEDIDALLKRATEHELAAERSDDPADKAAYLWFATAMRAKAERLAKQLPQD